MRLKHIFNAGLIGLVLFNTSSCRKSDTLDVDMSRYDLTVKEKTELDDWVTANLTDPYNIELVYRFDRNLTDVAKDISPIKMEKVKPTAEAIINIFLKTYEKVGGSDFIRKYTPKQFVLYGSPAYNSNGSITLGTADGGRRVVLYELNDLDFTNPTQVSRKMRTIHHEFTHILNQMIAIPPEFKIVTNSDYNEDWTNSANTAELAQSLGFISRYARSQYTEDFAEVVAHLLIEGQMWYDTYAKAAGAAAQAKLKKKEAIVVDYFKQYFNIDFRVLQYEVAKVLKEKYNETTKSFPYGIRNGMIVYPLEVNLSDVSYVDYGQSAKFAVLWEQVKSKIITSGNFRAVSFTLVFKSPTVMQLQGAFTNAAGTTTYFAWYDFNIAINADNDITFTFFDANANETNYNNGRLASVKPGWQPLIDFLGSKTFKADWMPATVGPRYWQKFAGFYVKDETDFYFYGKF